MPHLFSPISFRSVELKNRLVVSPMCQYSAEDGMTNDWHFMNYFMRAVSGAGLMMVEGTAVSPEGRITPWDLGIWKDEQVQGLQRIVRFAEDYGKGTVAGIQIAHAGR